MDITNILTRISNFRTKAIFADQPEVVTQLQQLIPYTLGVYEFRDFPNSEKYQENIKGFYEELAKLPEEWRPFKIDKKE